MKEEAFIDYAGPLMAVERLAKDAHDACLGHHYEGAQEIMLLLIAEARLALQSMRHINEKERAHEAAIATQKSTRRH